MFLPQLSMSKFEIDENQELFLKYLVHENFQGSKFSDSYFVVKTKIYHFKVAKK